MIMNLEQFQVSPGRRYSLKEKNWQLNKQPATPSPGEAAPSPGIYGDLHPHGVILMVICMNTCESNLKATKSKNKKPNPGLRYLPFRAVDSF